ncbi:uncharacterized protein LOC115386724 [Salarias fasciatus]|uniref:uncharacterized protein LOC115386724 n=1 Tax=Salarias fasciatus TaxID=181472 RepID=UPI001176CE4C|nr:uncharacterized protein LOC115386724 [Salarias fasciatus]
MVGASHKGKADDKQKVLQRLERTITSECKIIRRSMDKAIQAFEKSLNNGIEKSQRSCEKRLKSVIRPRGSGSGFHKTLRSVVEKGGVHKTQKGKEINLNMTLSSSLTKSIDKEFMKTFPNDREKGAFRNSIKKFSLRANQLTKKHKDLELILIFLKTEEDKIKTTVNSTIRDVKKNIYLSLTETIEDRMKPAYERAAGFKGKDSLKKMRETLENHVKESKSQMFREAKDRMLVLLNELRDKIVMDFENTLENSVKLSLCTDGTSVPDVSKELDAVNDIYDKLERSSR